MRHVIIRNNTVFETMSPYSFIRWDPYSSFYGNLQIKISNRVIMVTLMDGRRRFRRPDKG